MALHILPHAMTESFGVTGERLGFAPGQGPRLFPRLRSEKGAPSGAAYTGG